jgi:hypothetical protein
MLPAFHTSSSIIPPNIGWLKTRIVAFLASSLLTEG